MAKKKKKVTKKSTTTSPIDVIKQLESMGCASVKDMDQLKGDYSLSTGIIGLDIILTSERTGFPSGKIIEIYGANGTGKTSLTFNLLKQAADAGHDTFYFGMETAENESILSCFGLTPKSEKHPEGNVIIVQPNDGESCLNGIKTIFQTVEKPVIMHHNTKKQSANQASKVWQTFSVHSYSKLVYSWLDLVEF